MRNHGKHMNSGDRRNSANRHNAKNNLVSEIESIIIQRVHFSLEDWSTSQSQFDIFCNGNGKYLESDSNGNPFFEKEFSVPQDSFEKLCDRIIDIVHNFDRIDLYYDSIHEDVTLVFKHGSLTIPRGMGAKKKDVALIVQRFLNRYVIDQLRED